MGVNNKANVDSEAILMTLDQIGQTVEIMKNVVGSLHGYITEQIELKPDSDFERDLEMVTHRKGSGALGLWGSGALR